MEVTAESETDGPFVLLSGRVGLAGEDDASVGGARQRRLLAGLAVRRGQIVSADWLTDVVWYGDEPPDAPRKAIRTYVYRLRKALGDNPRGVRLETVDGAYRLHCPEDALDIDAFAMHAAAAAAAEESGRSADAIVEADQALELWKGEPFGEFANEPWALAEASRLREMHASVEERRAAALGSTSRFDEAVAELEGLARAMPLRERRRELLARALVRVGRPGDALREISLLRDALRREQGLDPTHAIVELERRILIEDPSLLQSTVLRTIGAYELTEQLDSDHHWSAWRGQHPSLDHEVHIVSFGVTVADDPSFVRNFDSQLRRISRLEHPAIVAIEDYWREPGSAHVVTRMLRGPSLESHLGSVDGFDGRFDDFVEQIGGALAAAHGDGVAHGAIGTRSVVSDHLGNWYLGGFANGDAIFGNATPGEDLFQLAALLRTVAAASGAAADVIPDAHGDDAVAYLGELRLRTRPTLRAPATDSTHHLTRNPYPGLRAFDDSERDLFFGRDALVDQVIANLSDDMRFTIVIGASGTGKSSLLHAGIIPALADLRLERVLFARLTPGRLPYERLAAALVSISASRAAARVSPERIRKDGLTAVIRDAAFDETEIVLAVDQLEELFTLSGDERGATAFLETLFAAAIEPGLPLRVIGTLRSDHFGALLTSEAIASRLSEALVPVPPFSTDQMQSVITGPAHLAGVDVEARLASALTVELVDRPSLLPHLQHLMRQLFDDRDGNLLAYRDYETLGGVTGSLGRAGEELLGRLTAAEVQALRRILRRLSHIGADGDVSRQRLAVADLAAGPDGDRVLRMLAGERLVVFDHDPVSRAPTVEITHEAIFRAWPRLAEWLGEDADAARLLEDLNERSRSWMQLDGDPGELLHGVRLEQTLDALPTVGDELSERELAFVEASRAAHDEEMARDLRRRRRLQVSLTIALVGLVASLSAGLYALRQRSDAEEAAVAAQENAMAAEVLRGEAVAQAELAQDAARSAEEQRTIADRRLLLGSVRLLVDENPRLGLLLANQLYGSAPSFETLSLLQESLVDLPRGLERYFGDAVPYPHVGVSPDGSRVAGLTQTHLEVWDAESGAQVIRRAAPVARDMVVSSTDVFVVDEFGGVARTTIASQVTTELEPPFAVRSIAAHDGRVVVGGDNGAVARAEPDRTWTTFPVAMEFPVNRVQVARDGVHVVATSMTNGSPAMVWNLETGEYITSHGHRGPHGIEHTRDAIVVGDSLASIGPDSSLQIRSLPDLSLLRSVDFVGSRLEPIDEQTFLAIGESGWLSVRSIATGDELDRFVGTATQRSGELSVSSDGAIAALATPTGVELWSLEGGRALPDSFVLDGPLDGFVAAFTAASADGLFPVVRADLANPGLVILEDGEPTTLWDQTGLSNAMSAQIFDDLGVVLSSDLSLRFVAFEGDTIRTLPDVGLNGLSESDTWAADRSGDTVAVVTGRTDSRIAIVERTGPDTIELVRTLPFSGAWPVVGFTPDGQHLVAAGDQVTVWDTSSWLVVWEADDLFEARAVGATVTGDDEVLILTIDGGVHRMSVGVPSVTHLQQLSTSGFPIHNLAYLLDTDLLLTAAPDEVGGSARLWDLDAGSQIGVSFPAAGEGSWLIADDELVTGEGNASHIWPVDVGTWPEHACRIAGRSLTADEWSEHGPTGAEFQPACSG